MRLQTRTLHTKIGNNYFRYKCEKVILSSGGRLRPSEARVKRPHKDKITFSPVYRTLFFHTTCGKLNLGDAFLFKRARMRTSALPSSLRSGVNFTRDKNLLFNTPCGKFDFPHAWQKACAQNRTSHTSY